MSCDVSARGTAQFTPTQYDETPLLAAPQSYVLASSASSQNFCALKSMHLQPLVVRS